MASDLKGNCQLFLLGLLLSISPALGANNTNTTAPSGATSIPMTTVSSSSPGVTSATTLPTITGTTASPTAVPSTSQPISTTTGVSTSNSSSVTSSSGMNSTMSSGGQANGTTGMINSSMSNIFCRSFMCNYSDCYSMYMSQNATMCPAGNSYCELIRLTGVCHTVSCSASCSMSCGNTSQSNCSVNCCNSTDCLNGTFTSMMMTSTPPAMTTTTTSSTPTTSSSVPTQGGNKCKSGKCNGTGCYKSFNSLQVCSSSHLHCQLKKETVGTNFQWTAGCTTNCSAQTPCENSTQPPCHLECCNATVTSCLRLNGTLNGLSVASRGLQLHSQLVISVLVVFAISLML